MKLRCNFCKFQKDDFCVKLKQDLPNAFAKLYYGGAVGSQAKNTVCNVEVEAETKTEDFVTFQICAPTAEEKLVCAEQ